MTWKDNPTTPAAFGGTSFKGRVEVEMSFQPEGGEKACALEPKPF
jgi:hypothetical protein